MAVRLANPVQCRGTSCHQGRAGCTSPIHCGGLPVDDMVRDFNDSLPQRPVLSAIKRVQLDGPYTTGQRDEFNQPLTESGYSWKSLAVSFVFTALALFLIAGGVDLIAGWME